MASVQSMFMQTNSSFSLRLSEPKRTFIFGSNSSNAEAKTEIGQPSNDRVLYSDKARSFKQSEHALDRNFIINNNKKCTIIKFHRSENIYMCYE